MASVTNLLRHGFDHNIDLLIDGYLTNVIGLTNTEQRQGLGSAERLHAFELLLQWGADPYKWVGFIIIICDEEDWGMKCPRRDLTRIAFIDGNLLSWLRILLKFGHSPFNALRSAVDLWVQLPGSFQRIYSGDLCTALREYGYFAEDFSDIMNGEDTRFYDLSVRTSSIDFEPGVITRHKELDLAEPTLVQRNARCYEDD